MTNNRWQIFPQNTDLAQKIADKMNINPIIAQILMNRKIQSLDLAQQFLTPKLNTTPVFDSNELLKCVTLIDEAIQQKTKILIYGDYDVDGITSISLMLNFFRTRSAAIEFYIPNRFSEGYGLSDRAVNYIEANRIGLVITVDCGISNTNEIKRIKERTQAKVIVMDHHSIPDILPNADAIINSKFLPENHPSYFLCAAGVVYKFLEFYCQYNKIEYDLTQDLDLVAIATIADVMPLIGENRVWVKKGLDVLAKRNRLGLRTLLEVVGLKTAAISVRDVGFMIAPYLNAAGRLETAHIGVELLTATRYESAESLALQLKHINETRQQIGAMILKEAEGQAGQQSDSKIIVLYGHDWHAGVIGITASQLARKFTKPVIMMSGIPNTTCRGSARTYAGINIYQLLKTGIHFFQDFGGHKEAAGFSIDYHQISHFKKFMVEKSHQMIEPAHLNPVLEVDCMINPTDITLDFAKDLFRLAPFGEKNPHPLFYSNKLHPIDFRCVGNTQKHLKVSFTDETGRLMIDGIGFDLGNKLPLLYQPNVEFVFNIDINEWKGTALPQLKLVDIKG